MFVELQSTKLRQKRYPSGCEMAKREKPSSFPAEQRTESRVTGNHGTENSSGDPVRTPETILQLVVNLG